MTGKLATLDGFIKGKSKLFSFPSFGKGNKENAATEEETEDLDDPEQEMKTFWFSKEPDGQEEASWLPGLVYFKIHIFMYFVVMEPLISTNFFTRQLGSIFGQCMPQEF